MSIRITSKPAPILSDSNLQIRNQAFKSQVFPVNHRQPELISESSKPYNKCTISQVTRVQQRQTSPNQHSPVALLRPDSDTWDHRNSTKPSIYPVTQHLQKVDSLAFSTKENEEPNLHKKSKLQANFKEQLNLAICSMQNLNSQFAQFPKVQQQMLNVIQILVKLQPHSKEQSLSNHITYKLSDQVQYFQNRCFELESKLKNSNDSKGASEYNRMKQIMEQLQTKMSLLVDENTKLNQQLCSYKSQMQDKDKQLDIQEKSYMKKIHSLESQTKDSFSVSKLEANSKIDENELKIISLQISNDNLKQELQHKNLDKKTIENLKEKITILQTKIQEQIKEKEITSNEMDQLEDKYNESKVQLKNLESQLENCKQQLRQKSDENQILDEKINQFQSHYNKLQMQISQNESYFKGQIEQAQQKQYEEQTLRSKSQQECQLLNDKLQNKADQLQKLENEFKQYQDRMSKSDEDNLKLHKRNEELNNKIQQMQLQVEGSKKEIEQIQEQYNYQIKQLYQQINTTEAQKNQDKDFYEKELQNYSSTNNSLQMELQNNYKKYNYLWQEIKQMKERFDERQWQEQKEKERTISQKQILEKNLEDMSKQNHELQKCLVKTETQLKSLQESESQMKKDKDQCGLSQEKYLELKKQNQQLFQQAQHYQSKWEELEAYKQSLQQQLDNINFTLARKNQEVNDKTEQLNQARKQIEEQWANTTRLEKKLLEKLELEICFSEQSSNHISNYSSQ